MRDAAESFDIGVAAEPEATPVPFGELFLPPRFRALVLPDDPRLPACTMLFAVEHGRAVCVELCCERREDGSPIGGEILRLLPIAAYTRAATRRVALRLVPDGDGFRLVAAWPMDGLLPIRFEDDGTPVYSGHTSADVPESERFDSQYARIARAPRRHGPPKDAELREIAEVYRGAVAQRIGPTRAVADRFSVSRSTAGRWIAEARRRGQLGKALPRMAGELEEEGKP